MTGTLIEQTGAPRDDARSDAERWGLELPPGLLDREESAGVWPDNIPALEAFCAVSTQWRMIALADGREKAVGLDYPAVRAGREMAGTEVTPVLWSALQMIEIGARAAMNGEAT